MDQDKNKLEQFSIPGKIAFSCDQEGYWKATIETAWSRAEIYLQGAHVTSFQKKGEAPLLFMSSSARVGRAHMLHGGIPLCFPWFANREGEKLSHGFARVSLWELFETTDSGEEVLLRFRLPHGVFAAAGWAPVDAELTVCVGKTLTLALKVHNSTQENFCYEECFHSYFFVGDITKASVHGLCGLTYLDKTEEFATKVEQANEVTFGGEVNSVYLNSSEPLEIHDDAHQRMIRVEKTNARSTVVWNPWKENAKKIIDFNPDDYQKMLCVEAGNVKEAALQLAPGETSEMTMTLSTF